MYKMQLGVLPEEIGQLTNLTHLNIRDNKLERVPETLCKLTKL